MAITRAPRATRLALVTAKIETTYNVENVPDPAADAILVTDPIYSIDPTVLERKFARSDMSPMGVRVTRKLANLEFTAEFRSNGLTNAGTLNSASKLGRLLRACGFSETAIAAGAATIGAARSVVAAGVQPTWAVGGGNTSGELRNYRLTVVLGGASATAKVRVTDPSGRDTSVLKQEGVTAQVVGTSTVTVAVSNTNPLAPTITIGGVFQAGTVINVNVNGEVYEYTVTTADTDINGIATSLAALIDAHALLTATPSTGVITIGYAGTALGVALTTGVTALSLGNSAGTVTATWSGSLTLGDAWNVMVVPPGVKYAPVSQSFESLTLYAYFDGKLHKMTGGLGTFQITAPAGNYATVKFTFTGQYIAPVDMPLPSTAVFETTQPAVVELAKLVLDSYVATVNQYTYDHQSQLAPRSDMNGADGYNGMRIVDRNPQGGIDPEDTLVRDYDWWGKLANATMAELSFRVGQTAGNTIWVYHPKIQYSGLSYQDREGIRTYDAGLRFTRPDRLSKGDGDSDNPVRPQS